MPKTTPDVVEAAAKCFHFNATDFAPQFIVIYSPHLGQYAIQTRRSFAMHLAQSPLTDWQVAIDLPSEGLMALMGFIPRNTSSKLAPWDFQSIPDPQPTDPPPEVPPEPANLELTPDADLAPPGAIPEADNASCT